MYRKVSFEREDVFALPLLVLLIWLHASEEEFLCMPKSAKTRAHSVPLDSKIGRNQYSWNLAVYWGHPHTQIAVHDTVIAQALACLCARINAQRKRKTNAQEKMFRCFHTCC